MTTPADARAVIDFILQLPKENAGLTSQAIEANLLVLAAVETTEARFGELLAEAEMAIATVQSALAALRDAAAEREARP